MSLKIDIDDYDYQAACKAVRKILAEIEAALDDNPELIDMPKASDIVDAVWDAIR